MKKLLLGLALLAGSRAAVHAQQRLSLFEEFSGENNFSCASFNPGLWAMLDSNATRILPIRFQTPIPTGGPIYNAYRSVTDARAAYYNVPLAPYGRLDGTRLGTGFIVFADSGHVANLLQSDLDAVAAVPAPFALTVTHAWHAAGDSLRATVTLTAPAAFAPAGAVLRLRLALIEDLTYPLPPGTNGETEFPNVVREMYPDAGGTALPATWAAGQSRTITLTGRVPAYVNKAPSADVRLVAWVQNDTNRAVVQAAVSAYQPLAVDVASAGLYLAGDFICDSAGTTLAPIVTLHNMASVALTSATIYYNVDGDPWQAYQWADTLAAQSSTLVGLPPVVVAPGAHVVRDSVAMPNGAPDVNGGNNTSRATVTVYDTVPAALPLTANFEANGAVPPSWILHDANANGQNWDLAPVGYANSRYSLRHNNADYFPSETNYAIIPATALPPGSARVLEFYVAYAQLFTLRDSLEVVYSTDCGTSWTAVWGRSGSALATAPPTLFTAGPFVPTPSQWVLHTVDLRAVPATAMLAFRAISGFGNPYYIDNLRLRAVPLATAAPARLRPALSLAPTPATTEVAVAFELAQPGPVQLQVLDALGRVVAAPPAARLSAGAQRVVLSTAALATGVYTVVVHTAGGRFTGRLAVLR